MAEIFCFRDLGLKKADAQFWDAVVARLAVPRAQMLMVGDDLDNDVLAPRRAGIASVRLNWKRAPTPGRSAAHGPPRMAHLVHFAWYAQPWFRPHPLVHRELREHAGREHRR